VNWPLTAEEKNNEIERGLGSFTLAIFASPRLKRPWQVITILGKMTNLQKVNLPKSQPEHKMIRDLCYKSFMTAMTI